MKDLTLLERIVIWAMALTFAVFGFMKSAEASTGSEDAARTEQLYEMDDAFHAAIHSPDLGSGIFACQNYAQWRAEFSMGIPYGTQNIRAEVLDLMKPEYNSNLEFCIKGLYAMLAFRRTQNYIGVFK